MRLITFALLITLFARCSFKEKPTNYSPIFIKYADQVLNSGFGPLSHAVKEGEKVAFTGRKITEGDSTISELEIAITEVQKLPFEDELPELGRQIGIAVKTVLLDTNQYQRYKISYSTKNDALNGFDEGSAGILVYAKEVESIPLNDNQFKPGLLKR